MILLVPTDFSKPSRVAAQYAAKLARKLDAKLVLLHIIDVPGSQRSLLKWQKLQTAMVEIAEEDGKNLVAALRKMTRGAIYISFEIVFGYPVAEVVSRAMKKYDADIVVMGTQGASGLKKVLMGSNAAGVIDSCKKPVIVVPEDTVYKDVKRIVHSTDMLHAHREVKELVAFAQLFDASIEVMHVKNPDGKPVDPVKVQADLRKRAGYPKIKFSLAKPGPIAKSIDEFVVSKKGDLLSMFTHQLSIREKLFDKSITRQMAFHLSVPLLALHKQK